MFRNFLTNPTIAVAVSKLGIVNLAYLAAQINPNEIAQWLSIATSVGVMIDTVFKWFKVNIFKKKKTSLKDSGKSIIDSSSNTIQPNIDSLKSK